jgi:hypothetical protein
MQRAGRAAGVRGPGACPATIAVTDRCWSAACGSGRCAAAVVTAWAHGQVAPPAGLMLVQVTKAA